MSSRIRGVSKQFTRTFLVWLGVRFLAVGQRLITRTVRASISGKQAGSEFNPLRTMTA